MRMHGGKAVRNEMEPHKEVHLCEVQINTHL